MPSFILTEYSTFQEWVENKVFSVLAASLILLKSFSDKIKGDPSTINAAWKISVRQAKKNPRKNRSVELNPVQALPGRRKERTKDTGKRRSFSASLYYKYYPTDLVRDS